MASRCAQHDASSGKRARKVSSDMPLTLNDLTTEVSRSVILKMRERFPFSATKQLGLLHPDRTLTVYAPEIGIEQVRREAADFDENQDNPALFTKVVSLRVEDIEVLEVPSLKAATTPVADQ